MEVDGVKIVQSVSIARFAARECNLVGKSSLEQAQADAIVDTILELINYYYSSIFHIQDAAEKAAKFQEFLANQGAKGAVNVEKLISLYGKNGYSVGDSLTWADLMIYDICHSLFTKVPTFAQKYTKLSAVYELVAKNEKVSEYVKARPETAF